MSTKEGILEAQHCKPLRVFWNLEHRCKDWGPQDGEGTLPHSLNGDLGPASVPHWASGCPEQSVTWAVPGFNRPFVQLSVTARHPFFASSLRVTASRWEGGESLRCI